LLVKNEIIKRDKHVKNTTGFEQNTNISPEPVPANTKLIKDIAAKNNNIPATVPNTNEINEKNEKYLSNFFIITCLLGLYSPAIVCPNCINPIKLS